MLKIFFIINFLFIHAYCVYAQSDKQYVKMGATILEIDQKQILAISLENETDWHTYWKNPGDAGLELKFQFSKDDGTPLILEDFPWPTPTRYIEQGNMWAYGYSNKYAFFYKLPLDLKNSKLKIVGTWLVCKDICIPGTRTIHLSIDDNLKGDISLNHSKNDLIKIFQNLPIYKNDPNLSIFLTKGTKDNQLALHYILENVDLNHLREKSNILTPYLQEPFDYKHEEVYFDKNSKIIFGRIYLDWDGVYNDPIWNLPVDGKFKTPITAKYLLNYPKDKPSKIISITFEEFSLTGDDQLNARFKNLQKIENTHHLKSVSTTSPYDLLSYILFAFIGGLILNLMPCVLPVISLKLFGLIIHRDESKKEILKHNMAYTFGVLFSFFILATSIAILKSAGDQIGWGFQLQSPIFVFAMILLIFIMALNMLGLFQFMTPGGKSLGNAEIKKGVAADFLNGVLATILSTPCSAPFLGTALSVAFTTSIFNSYLIFMSVGIGLSFPFIITALFPSLIKFLPKPGLWMEKLKMLLGLTLLLTVIWLIDVLFAIVSFQDVGIYFNAALVFIFFLFFAKKHISKGPILTLICALLCIFFIYKTISLFDNMATNPTTNQNNSSTLNWKPWSKAAMDSIEDEYLFINFTASWCLTCKVNKKLVLQSKEFETLVQENGINLMEADWTKRDDAITTFLNQHNIYGVPAYFIKDKKGNIKSLGETISISKIQKALLK